MTERREKGSWRRVKQNASRGVITSLISTRVNQYALIAAWLSTALYINYSARNCKRHIPATFPKHNYRSANPLQPCTIYIHTPKEKRRIVIIGAGHLINSGNRRLRVQRDMMATYLDDGRFYARCRIYCHNLRTSCTPLCCVCALSSRSLGFRFMTLRIIGGCGGGGGWSGIGGGPRARIAAASRLTKMIFCAYDHKHVAQ